MTAHVFTPDGDPKCEAEFVRRGINHHWMPPAVVHDECTTGTFVHRYNQPVIFVGTEHYLKEWPYRTELLAFLRDKYRSGFRRYGNGMEVVRGQALNDLYATTSVVVGDSLCPGYTHSFYWSDRVCETIGRGGYLVHPRVPGLDRLFTDGEHLRFYDYGDWEGLRKIIDAALVDPEGRKRVKSAGRAHVLARHTYRHRLAWALDIMGLPCVDPPEGWDAYKEIRCSD